MKAHIVGTRIEARDREPLVHRLISIGFAVCALASASIPALGWPL